ncbi:glycoside hydrolase family 97 protein [Echinicola rosea]|uniref:Alpha-glucosidase n=1 Tax=Echinicola rosea TaxID=1807691 RepID=A0ABQ1USW9_9BACT|nr:glycoside hydrolase family 97 protein [Echinicola rosea]GGF25437.1 alpha-glucosidase [Echinicola rosea]
MPHPIKPIVLILLLIWCTHAKAQETLSVSSPNGTFEVAVSLDKGIPSYSVTFQGEELVAASTLELDFEEKWNYVHSQWGKANIKTVEEEYELVVGKAKKVVNTYGELAVPLLEKNEKGREMLLRFRVFDDGVAFRHEFPKQENWQNYVLLDEKSSFVLSGDPEVTALLWGHYHNSHEGLYQKSLLSEVKQDTLVDVPSLFEYDNGTLMAITEANLRDYAGMYLTKDKEGILHTALSPLPGQEKVKVKANLPHKTPWRVMMISHKIGDLIASNILTNLADPPETDDWSWLKPGKTSFHWWNGDIMPDTTFAPGANFHFNKYYIDFCAANDIEYHAVIGYGGFAWYPNDWPSYGQPGSYADLTKTVSSLDMQQICDYAASKGVGIHVWVHWEALYPQLEEAFSQFEQWGIKGMMVDFLNRDDQEMVKIQEEILQSAAKHHLYIQFHGAHKPTGLHRTFPNELTREGTYNYEQNKWLPSPLTPEHDLDIVFTRMLAGASDYHLGGFRATNEDAFKTQYTRPLMGGTRCHMLAMYVVLESYLNMVADYPDAYKGQEGFDFIREVPTVWDETVVPTAKLGQYAVITRRKGEAWFVGGINNSKERSLTLELDFLDDSKSYQATIYQDTKKTVEDPNALEISHRQVKKGDQLPVQLAAGGGVAIKIMEDNATAAK